MKNKLVGVFVIAIIVAIVGTYFFKKVEASVPKPTTSFAVNGIAPNNDVNPYEIGDKVKEISLKNIDGKVLSFASFPSAKGFVVVFTCNHCPFSKAYEDRVIAIDKKYASLGYPVLAINPNDPEAYEEDSFENMKLRASEKGYTFPYLVDDKQLVSKTFGATRTPHAFIIKKENDGLVLKYMGAIDDNAQDAAGVSKRYLEEALNNLIQNKPVITQSTKAIGCAIKWID